MFTPRAGWAQADPAHLNRTHGRESRTTAVEELDAFIVADAAAEFLQGVDEASIRLSKDLKVARQCGAFSNRDGRKLTLVSSMV